MKNIKNILAVNFGGIGDEILFLPTLTSLKKEFPNAKITIALEPRSKGIADITNTIDDLILVDIKRKNKYIELLKFIIEARKKRFDIAISSGGNKFISIILFLIGAKHNYGYDTGLLSRILLTKTIPLNKKQYAAKMYHDLVKHITNIKTLLPELNIQIKPKVPNSVLIHPGVSKLSVELGIIKTIPAEKWANIIDLLIDDGKRVILAGGPDDKECIEIIRNTIKNKESDNFIDYFGKTKNLTDLAELISSAEKFVCSDSAPLHIAVALQTKTYAIFGPTDYKKLIPQLPAVSPILAKDKCTQKPCLWERRKTTCKKLGCLNISPEEVVSIIKS